jgi:hypothetical protein
MWKPHTDFLVCKLGAACFVITRLSHVLGIDAIKTAYYSYFHSLIKHDIISWGNSTNTSLYTPKKDYKNNVGNKFE